MGGDKGSADSSGMMEAMASAQAAQEAYQLGEQQFQWSQQVWNQEQPLVDASEQAQLNLSNEEAASLTQSQDESAAQWQQYQDTFMPLQTQFAGQAENWASPEAMAQARSQAMSSVAEQGQAGLNSAAETLRSYGVNPADQKYASLYTSAQPMLGAAEAAAGTTAAQNLRMQQMELEGQALNTGQGLAQSTAGLTQAGTGAGSAASGSASGAGQTAFGNLSGTAVGAGATSNLFNAGTNAMNSYVGAVNGYNQSQAEFAQAGAQEMSGFGQALGSLAGIGAMHFVAKGGPIYKFDDGGMVPGSDPQLTPDQGGGATGIPSSPLPPAQVPPGAPSDATPGGGVPAYASPSNGQQTDDVPAMLTANEFVIPKDVATWVGHKALSQQIDKARQEQQKFAGRDDIGGEPTAAIPQSPTFVSRPTMHLGTTRGAIPGMPA